MSDPRLVTPAEVEDLVIDVLKARHTEHLAAQERRQGLAPRTLQRLRTVRHMATLGYQHSDTTCPAVLVGCFGSGSGAPSVNEDDAIDLSLNLSAEVAVIGQDRRDTLRRRDWTSWTVLECLLARVPRSDLVSAITLRDFENIEDGARDAILGRTRFVFDVTVPSALSIGGFPGDEWPEGGPGGPPEEPYESPVPLGQATDIQAELEREEIS